MSSERPVVMYACIHNSGRSVAAKVLTEHYAAGRVEVQSAGSEPGSSVNPGVTAVLAERGLSTDDHVPSLLTVDSVQDSDVVVTMGCGETCPVFPGKRYEDWQVADPKGEDLETVRRIVDDVDDRVRALLADLGALPPPGSCRSRHVQPAPARSTPDLPTVGGDLAEELPDTRVGAHT